MRWVRRAVTVLGILSLSLEACATRDAGTTPPPAAFQEKPSIRGPSPTFRHPDVTDLTRSGHGSSGDYRMLLRLYRHTAHPYRKPNPENTILALAIVDGHGRILSEAADRSDTRIIRGRQGTGSGSRVRPLYPCGGQPRCPITGPIHTLTSSSTPVDPSNGAFVSLPCDGTVEAGDGLYAYLGGKTNVANSQVESGEQFNPNGANDGGTWQPYISIAAFSYSKAWPGNGDYYNIDSSTSGTGNLAHWLCGLHSQVSVNQSFFNEVSYVTGVSGPYYPCFINSSSQNTSTGMGIGEIFWAVCVATGGNTEKTGWKGWLSWFYQDNGCTCYLMQSTSIGWPNGELQPNDGSYNGPVAWSHMYVGDGTVYYTGCTNTPGWNTASNECGNTPTTPPPLYNSVIQVSNQNLSSGSAQETVIVNNTCCNWVHTPPP